MMEWTLNTVGLAMKFVSEHVLSMQYCTVYTVYIYKMYVYIYDYNHVIIYHIIENFHWCGKYNNNTIILYNYNNNIM